MGTGKTHLLASLYHALHPTVPCAFLHSKELFRATEHPEAYARRLAARHRVLLLDEVELDDPANEVRLILVLKTLAKLGVTVAATSNAEPERFVSAQFGRDRLERFISEEFRRQYHVVFVGGEDYRRRLAKPGVGWIGPHEAADAALRRHFEKAPEPKRLLSTPELLRLATDTERTALASELLRNERLYLADVAVTDTDDALRLLRVVDDLYTADAPPALFFSSEVLPDAWFTAAEAHAGLEAAIAEKFERAVSRIHAMCRMERVGAALPKPS